tara:strand:- start:362 stop:1030 length:669 start_codon:yes stop_codon:yes gene_type:complete
MSQSNYITLVLFAVIGLVFLVDYLKKSKEDSLEKSIERFVENKTENKSLFFIDFILFAIVVFILYVLIIWALGRFIPEIPFYKSTNYHTTKFYNFIILYSWIPTCLSLVLGRFMFIKKIGFFISTNNHKLVIVFNKFLNKILKRKKNITISLLLISFFKVFAHYILYPYKVGRSKSKYGNSGEKDFGYYFDLIFTERLELFIPVVIVFLIVIWFFNDKIKAQ